MRLKNNTNKLEKKEAEKDGAKLVRNSGRGADKGDAKLEDFLLDYKFIKKSFQFKLADWKKLWKDAWQSNNRSPIIVLKFDDGTKLAIIEWEYIKDFVGGSDG